MTHVSECDGCDRAPEIARQVEKNIFLFLLTPSSKSLYSSNRRELMSGFIPGDHVDVDHVAGGPATWSEPQGFHTPCHIRHIHSHESHPKPPGNFCVGGHVEVVTWPHFSSFLSLFYISSMSMSMSMSTSMRMSMSMSTCSICSICNICRWKSSFM